MRGTLISATGGRNAVRSVQRSSWSLTVRLLFVVHCALSLAAPAAASESGGTSSRNAAVTIAADSFARSQVVALSRDLVVHGTVYGNASVLRGNAVVSGSIGGDLVVLEGSVLLEDGARIGGDVVVLGGVVTTKGGASVVGRTLAYPSASRAILGLIEVPSLGGRPVLLSAKIGLLLAWWLAGALLVSLFHQPMKRTADEIARHPMASFFVGLTFLLMSALGFILLSAVIPEMISLPLLVLVVLVAFALKIWGVVAVLLSAGRFLAGRFQLPSDLLGQFLLGLVLVGCIQLLPWLGAMVWSALTLVGMGAALRHALSPAD